MTRSGRWCRAVRALVISCKMAEGNLVRTVPFDFEPGKVKYFHITGQYMAADINSWQILLDDLDAAYRQLEAGEPIAVPRKTTSAKQWAERLAERAKPGGMPQQELDYWLAQAPLNPPRFPMDHESGRTTGSRRASSRRSSTSKRARSCSQQVPRFLGVQIDAILVDGDPLRPSRAGSARARCPSCCSGTAARRSTTTWT